MECSGGSSVGGQMRIQTPEPGYLGVSLTFTFATFLGNVPECPEASVCLPLKWG